MNNSGIKIEYVGHSCFLITNSKNQSVLIDPFHSEPGQPQPLKQANVVLISHNHTDHNNLKMVMGASLIINGASYNKVNSFEIQGFLADHGHINNKWLGMVVCYKIQTDDLSILHLSDMAVVPDKAMVEAFGNVDILMIPCGGHFTLNASQATETVNLINPSVSIPMHYASAYTDRNKYPISTANEFIEQFHQVKHIRQREITITKDVLPPENSVWVMTPEV
ncbi:MAG: MBL fold metallo-hydrolase [Vulcanimicrobiota bacterium]